MSVLFSVIINCHNSEKYLSIAIESVLQQTFQDFEIIVFDNFSMDNTKNISKSFGDRVIYFYSDCMLTLGEARNAAVAEAKGEYVAFLDSDDLWLPNKLEVQASLIRGQDEEGSIALIGSDGDRVTSTLEKITSYSSGRLFWSEHPLKSFLHDCFIPMSSAVVKKSIWVTEGGCNTAYNIIEEYDLWLRIARRYRVVYIPQSLVLIRFHENNSSRRYTELHNEIDHMFKQVKNWGEIKNKDLNNALVSWKFRKMIVELLYPGSKKFYEILWHLTRTIGLFIRYPTFGIKFLFRNSSKSLIKFLKTKYG